MSSRALLIRSSRFRSAALVTTLCACVASVGQVPPPLEAPAVAVEHDTYRVRRVRDGDVLELTIVATYTNRTPDTIVLHPCYGRRQAVALEKWVGGEWKSAFDQGCPDILDRAAPRLAPGESRTDTSLLFASLYASGCDSSQARRARPMSEWNGSVGPEQLSPPASSAAHAIA